MDPEETVALIIDNGAHKCIKAGPSGEDAPSAVFASVIGTSRNHDSLPGTNEYYVGGNAQERRDILSLSYPIQNGVVADWDGMEAIWRYAFTEQLRIKSDEHSMLITEPPFNPNPNREKTTEVMFETFNTPAYYVAIPAHLAVYANGHVSSLVYDCGEGVSHVILVYKGHSNPHATQRTNIAGNDVTLNLAKLLGEHGLSFTTSSELETVREIKEKLGYVSFDFEKGMSKSPSDEVKYILPDGTEITVGKDRFRASECIFEQSTIGLEVSGAHELINKCLEQCDIDMRKDLFCNIIMSGGTTMFPGFSDRMKREMRKFVPDNVNLNIISPPERLDWWFDFDVTNILQEFLDN